MSSNPLFDSVGYWSEIKHEILARYSHEYTKILRAQGKFQIAYIDGFSGAGMQFAKVTGEPVEGSPLLALETKPPFDLFHFVDLNSGKAEILRKIIGEDARVTIHTGDCNRILPDVIFPKLQFNQYKRALCILDPYGLQLDWKVIEDAGKSRAIEIFLNFPVMDMNRNVLWRDPDRVSDSQRNRMSRYWGDDSWRESVYEKKRDLFGEYEEKRNNDALAEGFRKRLQEKGGFAYVPPPLPMRNEQGAVVYYLYFASQKEPAEKIVSHIFDKFRSRGKA